MRVFETLEKYTWLTAEYNALVADYEIWINLKRILSCKDSDPPLESIVTATNPI